MSMASGYILGDVALLNKLSINKRNSFYWTIVYIRGGRGMYLLGHSLRCLNEGDIIVFPPGVSYSFAEKDLGDEYNINLDTVVLRFDRQWLDAVLAAFPIASGMILKVREIRNPLTVVGPKWIRMSNLLDNLMAGPEHLQPHNVLGILELLSDMKDFHSLSGSISMQSDNLADRKEKIERFLSCNFARKVTLEEVSSYVGMSRTYFSLLFKTLYGEGFADHLTRIRVEKSMDMLAFSSKQLPAIASECGFTTVQYFNRAFKKVTGITPGAYRKENSRLVHKDD